MAERVEAIPVVRPDGLVEEFVIERANLLAPVRVAAAFDEAVHVGKQRRRLHPERRFYEDPRLAERAGTEREQLGVEPNRIGRGQFFRDPLHEPIDVPLRRPGGQDRQNAAVQPAGERINFLLRDCAEQAAGAAPAGDQLAGKLAHEPRPKLTLELSMAPRRSTPAAPRPFGPWRSSSRH